MSKKTTKSRPPQLTAAHMRGEIYALNQEREFLEEFGHMSNRELHDASHTFSILATKLRALAWTRQGQAVQAN